MAKIKVHKHWTYDVPTNSHTHDSGLIVVANKKAWQLTSNRKSFVLVSSQKNKTLMEFLDHLEVYLSVVGAKSEREIKC